MPRWTLLFGLVLSLTACKKGGDTTPDDTQTTDDSAVDDTQAAETGTVAGEVEFPVKPPVGPLIIVASTTDDVFASVVHTETVNGPSFPENQAYSFELEAGDYYLGAWIDSGSNSPDSPGSEDPRGVASMGGGPVKFTVTAGEETAVPAVKLRAAETDE